MSKKYDFIVIGAGFAGATCARLLTNKGYKCLIIEERPFVGGNCVTERRNNIDIHFFGGHILHTNNENVWNFLSSFGEIVSCKYPIIAWKDAKSYRLPYNMDLIQQIYNVTWPHEANEKLKNDIIDIECKSIKDFGEKYFGRQLYELFMKGFYEKMFNMPAEEITYLASLESKTNFNNHSLLYSNSFYDDKWQGIPENGYVDMIENIIGDDIDILLNTNFLSNKDKYISLGTYTICTIEIDKFFNYCMGNLLWASSYFEFNDVSDKTNNLSGVPITTFPGKNPEWFRMTEHKWLTPWRLGEEEFDSHSFITYEYFKKWEPYEETTYPIYSNISLQLYERYVTRLKMQYPNVLLCGRRAKYDYSHICDVVESAMNLCELFPEKHS